MGCEFFADDGLTRSVRRSLSGCGFRPLVRPRYRSLEAVHAGAVPAVCAGFPLRGMTTCEHRGWRGHRRRQLRRTRGRRSRCAVPDRPGLSPVGSLEPIVVRQRGFPPAHRDRERSSRRCRRSPFVTELDRFPSRPFAIGREADRPISSSNLDLLGAEQVEDAAGPKNTSAIQAVFASPVGWMLYDNAQALSRWLLTAMQQPTEWLNIPAGRIALDVGCGPGSVHRVAGPRCGPGQARLGRRYLRADADTCGACRGGTADRLPAGRRATASPARRDGHHTSCAVSNAAAEDLIHSRKLNVQFRIGS
jgi:hypothetical protein